jgi:putative membrane protein
MTGWGDCTLPWLGIAGPLLYIGFIFLCVFLLVAGLRLVRRRGGSADGGRALGILNERFARGEIDRKEYDERRRAISAA